VPAPAEPAALGSAADPAGRHTDRLHRGHGDDGRQRAAARGIHVYAANRSMDGRYFYDADGELLIVPQQGRLTLATELGVLDVEPLEIAVVPRGVRFQVRLPEACRARLRVRELRRAVAHCPISASSARTASRTRATSCTPVAAYEAREGDFELVAKFKGRLWRAAIDHSPLDVVAWHGNYAPYKYDLRRFNTIGSISYDHPDPSIFLVLHALERHAGVATSTSSSSRRAC
jgi:homogentisate 1,2-dioxygenase